MDQQAEEGGDRGGECHPHRRSLARSSFKSDLSAQPLHPFLHNRHAQAMARDIRDEGARAETGTIDQVERLLVRQRFRRLGGQQTGLDRRRSHVRRNNPASIILNADLDPPALQGSDGHGDLPSRRLACLNAGRRRLDAVVNRVAHQVDERVLDRLQHFPVHFQIASLHRPAHVFAMVFREIAHHSLEDIQHTGSRHHPQLSKLIEDAVHRSGYRPLVADKMPDKLSSLCFQRPTNGLLRIRGRRMGVSQRVEQRFGFLDAFLSRELGAQQLFGLKQQGIQPGDVEPNGIGQGRGDRRRL